MAGYINQDFFQYSTDKWTELNLRWLIVDIDGCVKEGKRLTIIVNF